MHSESIEAFGPIPRSGELYSRIAEYSTAEKYDEVRKTFLTRKFTVGETDTSYRLINHWGESGLIPTGAVVNSGWKKFTFSELVWIKVVHHLREYGVSLEKIEQVMRCVMKFETDAETYPIFESYILTAWRTGKEVYVVVWPSGIADIVTSEELENYRAQGERVGSDMLLVSVKGILDELRVSGVIPYEIMHSLSNAEKVVIDEVRDERNQEVLVKNKGHEFDIESSRTDTTPPLHHEITTTIRKEKAYMSVTENFVAGERKAVRITKKRRVKK